MTQLERRIITWHKQGYLCKKIAQLTGVSQRQVGSVISKYSRRNTPKKPRKPREQSIENAVRELVEAGCDKEVILANFPKAKL